MARIRYRIDVYGKRGDQPCYKYNQHPIVKPAKADRLVIDAAIDIRDHENRSGGYCTSVVYYPGGAIVRVGICKFIIRKAIIHG